MHNEPVWRAVVRAPMVAALVAGVACAATPPRPAPVAAEASPSAATVESRGEAPALDAARRAYWTSVVGAEGEPPDGRSPEALAPELVALLGDPDPSVRDGIAYVLLNRWLRREPALSDDAVRALLPALIAGLEVGAGEPGADDRVFQRSFSALVLSDLAARDADAAFLTDAELADLLDRAIAYAGAETDLRGYTGGQGWAHAAAHTGDWLAALARNPRLDAAACGRILDAVAGLALRRHGHIFQHGEDSRLARPVIAVLTRDAIDEPAFEAWTRAVIAPLLERGGDAFDPSLYAAQRNARNLIVSVFLAVELAKEAPPGIVMARAVLRRVLG